MILKKCVSSQFFQNLFFNALVEIYKKNAKEKIIM